MLNIWESLIKSPLKGRLSKPRPTGVTMVIDKGLSLSATAELLELAAPYCDFIKLTFGTMALYPQRILEEKLALAAEYQVNLYPGGTFFELHLDQGKLIKYYKTLRQLGFEWVEISDGSIHLSEAERSIAILSALETGLKVITEVGKKNPLDQPDDLILVDAALHDLELGAQWVIIEARESGHGIGIYDSKGNIIEDKLAAFSDNLPPERVIWEAPLKNQQAKLINQFGPNVNLGNIPPAELLALEALRLGFRSDTWKIEGANVAVKI